MAFKIHIAILMRQAESRLIHGFHRRQVVSSPCDVAISVTDHKEACIEDRVKLQRPHWTAQNSVGTLTGTSPSVFPDSFVMLAALFRNQAGSRAVQFYESLRRKVPA